jgi:hypothetical protein
MLELVSKSGLDLLQICFRMEGGGVMYRIWGVHNSIQNIDSCKRFLH